MQSVKIKSTGSDNNQNKDKKISEEEFHRALKSFQKISQETKRETKKHEYYVSPRVEKRTKRNASKKNKRRKK